MKSVKCFACGLVNFAAATICKRCQNSLFAAAPQSSQAFTGSSPAPTAANFAASPNNFSAQTGVIAGQNFAAPENDLSGKYLRKMFFGALWAIGGMIVTAASYQSAAGGGRYMIFWGAILFGAFDFLIGLNGYVNNKS